MITYTITKQCKRLSDVPQGASILDVNGRNVYGHCENCGKPIYVGADNYHHDSEGIIWHKRCPSKRRWRT